MKTPGEEQSSGRTGDRVADRVGRFRELLESELIDLAVTGPTSQMRYLIGGSPHADERFCALFIDESAVRMVVPKLNAEMVASYTTVPLLTWEDAEGLARAIRSSVAPKKGIRRLAVDGAMRADFLLPLITILAPGEIVAVDPILSILRRRKSPEEITALAKAAEQADRAVEAVMKAIGPGVTEQELAWEAERTFRTLGAEQVSFTLVAIGENTAYPHHSSGGKPLGRGECVLCDIGASLKGYQSDITRTAFFGDPTEEFMRVYTTVLEANSAGRSAVRPGVSLGDVDKAARSVIIEAGYGEYFIHRTGHGIGLDVHEAPWVTAGNPDPVEEGMVFSVEPGIYLPGKFGVRIEDIVAVTYGGARVLTGFRHELVIT